MSATPGVVHHTGPALGQHNVEVFQGLLGLDDDRYATLVADGVI